MLTMLLGGLWHGAAMRFVIWGGLHGIFLVVQRLWHKQSLWIQKHLPVPKVIQQILAMTLVFSLTCITWIFFRANNLGDAMIILKKIVLLEDFSLDSIRNKLHVIKGIILIAFVIVTDWMDERYDFLNKLHTKPWQYVPFLCLVLWLTFLFGNLFANAFIYFVF